MLTYVIMVHSQRTASKTLQRRLTLTAALSGKQLENVAFGQKSLHTHDLNHNIYTPWYSNTIHTYMWDIVMFIEV